MGNSDNMEKYQNVWQKFQQGDDNALSLIYFDFFDLLLGFGMKYSSDRYLVEDCIQNLFVSLLKNRGEQKAIQNIRFYLLKGLKNQMAYEKRKKKNLIFKANTEETDFRISYSVESVMIDLEKSQLKADFLRKVTESLTNRQREALYLKYICGFDYIQIAEIMEISVESGRTMIYRTLKSLNETFGTDKHANIILWSFLKLYLRYHVKTMN